MTITGSPAGFETVQAPALVRPQVLVVGARAAPQSTPPAPRRGSSRSTGGWSVRGRISPSNGKVSHSSSGGICRASAARSYICSGVSGTAKAMLTTSSGAACRVRANRFRVSRRCPWRHALLQTPSRASPNPLTEAPNQIRSSCGPCSDPACARISPRGGSRSAPERPRRLLVVQRGQRIDRGGRLRQRAHRERCSTARPGPRPGPAGSVAASPSTAPTTTSGLRTRRRCGSRATSRCRPGSSPQARAASSPSSASGTSSSSAPSRARRRIR